MKRLFLAAALVCAGLPAMATEFPDCDAPISALSPTSVAYCLSLDHVGRMTNALRRTVHSQMEDFNASTPTQGLIYRRELDPNPLPLPSEYATPPKRVADPPGSVVELCPKPRHMTAHDGCQ